MAKVKRQFTAVFKKDAGWYLGWIEEIPGVNTQGKTLAETRENLKDALLLTLETNKTITKTQDDEARRELFTVTL